MNKEKILSEWYEFLRFPTIATDALYAKEVRACSQWLFNYLSHKGLNVECWETSGAPTIFASNLNAGPDKETILFYGHYDVQPVDPLEAWVSPPFEPTLREGQVYARGASDDKGQIFYTIAAIGDFLARHGTLPINLKILIEGEEESASTGLKQLLKTKKNELKADHLVVVDSGLDTPGNPVIALGGRGIVTMTVTIQESTTDLHSGQCGGLAYNPNRALIELLATLHDSNGRVTIPGFYDHITSPSAQELADLRCTFDSDYFEKCYGFRPHGMETGIDPITANWLQPTLEINGIGGGYTGPGFKTVIPASALAKISCRLVPKQCPEIIAQKVADYLIKHAPTFLKTTVDILPGGGPGFRSSPISKIAQLAEKSYSDVFHKPCHKILMGGSIPIVPDLLGASGAEGVLIGTALPSNRIHAPNEHFALESFEQGYHIIYRLLELFQ